MKTILFFAFTFSALALFSCSSDTEDKTKDGYHEMENRLSEFRKEHGDTSKPKENPYKNAKLEAKVFNNDSLKKDPNLHGFGYDIYMFDALYVHQPHVPAINGNRGFHSREQAQKTADLVLYKIRNNIMPPSLTVRELDSIGVLK